MSRLVDPGPGEILDRLTILQLKLLYGWLKDQPTTHWAEEYVVLAERLPTVWKAPVWERLLELAAVNAALWQAEDDMRRLRNLPVGERAEWAGLFRRTWVQDTSIVGVKIQQLNDRRAALITLINTTAGIERPSDKL